MRIGIRDILLGNWIWLFFALLLRDIFLRFIVFQIGIVSQLLDLPISGYLFCSWSLWEVSCGDLDGICWLISLGLLRDITLRDMFGCFGLWFAFIIVGIAFACLFHFRLFLYDSRNEVNTSSLGRFWLYYCPVAWNMTNLLYFVLSSTFIFGEVGELILNSGWAFRVKFLTFEHIFGCCWFVLLILFSLCLLGGCHLFLSLFLLLLSASSAKTDDDEDSDRHNSRTNYNIKKIAAGGGSGGRGSGCESIGSDWIWCHLVSFYCCCLLDIWRDAIIGRRGIISAVIYVCRPLNDHRSIRDWIYHD